MRCERVLAGNRQVVLGRDARSRPRTLKPRTWNPEPGPGTRTWNPEPRTRNLGIAISASLPYSHVEKIGHDLSVLHIRARSDRLVARTRLFNSLNRKVCLDQ